MNTNHLMRPLVAAALVAMSVSAHANSPAVTRDKILMHGEFIPRFASYLPRVLVVRKGETVTLPQSSVFDAIEVQSGGTLRVARTRDTSVTFTHLTILPGGTLDVGTVDDPIPCQFRVQLTVRDVPIDLERDPFQWGNGLLNLGHQSRVGCAVEKAWTELSVDAEAGAQQLQLDVPEGWRVGDELLLPDLRQISRNAPIRREAKVVITAIDGNTVTLSGNTVTLSKPLEFEHKSILDPDGAVVVKPRVANLTRNIVIGSENPAGTRGHTVNAGEATWDIRYNQLVGLGRTRAENLDSTTADPSGAITHVGTNQIARYASHDHHVHAHGHLDPAHPHTGHFLGNVLIAEGPGKWGHVVHGSHDTHVEENVAVGFVGAGFVTEDGYEVRNVFRRNVAVYSEGNGINASSNIDPRRGRDCPGCEGAGFWFRGLHQTIEGNEAWNNHIGLNLFAMHQVTGRLVPGAPGREADTLLDPTAALPLSIADNVTIGNLETGHEQWGTRRFPVVRALSAHNGQMQVRAGQSNIDLWMQDPTIVASGGLTHGISTSEAYVGGLEVDGGRIVGCDKGFVRGGARLYVHLRNLFLQCRSNIDFTGLGFAAESTYENLTHAQLGSFPKRYIVLGHGTVWQPGTPVLGLPPRLWHPARGSRHLVTNWQGTGADYRLYENQQKASAPAWPADGSPGTDYYCPEAGLTAGQCWDQYGMAYGGGVIPDHEAVELDGVLNGVARAGLATTLGIPRAVLATPNMLAPAKVIMAGGRPRIQMKMLLTGDPKVAKDVAVVQIDGAAPARYTRTLGKMEHETSFESEAVSEGIHTVRTWREDAGGVIPGSMLTFRYFVARPTPQPQRDMSRR
jgi:hypothetical protein